ncbi:MAG: TonB-dependent receptor [Bacteroidetes bacterium]|nr:TonB-dependent receptor [Bacteroidota bacterium]
MSGSRNTFLFFSLIFTFCLEVNAQPARVQGAVRDSMTLEPLGGVNVYIENTKTGTWTNKAGVFILELPSSHASIVISYVGYATKKLSVAESDSVIVYLSPMAYVLQGINVFSRVSSIAVNEGHFSLMQSRNGEVEKITGMTKDVFRVVQTLPGVSVNNEASAKFNVRGGTSDENLVVLNGVQVYEPYHLQEDPLTSLGIFNIDMVQKIDFFSGAFSAEFGDAMSSVMSIDYRSGDRDRLKGKASVSAIDFNLLAEGPFFKNGSFLFGLRKSYLEQLMRMLGNSPSVHPSFYDLQGQVEYDLSPANKIRLTMIHSADDYQYDPTTAFNRSWDLWNNINLITDENQFVEENFTFSNNLISLRSINFLDANLLNEVTLSYYAETSDLKEYLNIDRKGTFQGHPEYFTHQTWFANLSEKLATTSFKGTTAFTYQVTPFTAIKSGFSYERLSFDVDQLFFSPSRVLQTNSISYPDTSYLIDPPDPQYNDTTTLNVQSFKLAAYAEGNFQLFNSFVASLGARFDYFDMNKQSMISPRLSFSYHLPFGTTLRAGWGIFYESPTYKQLKIGVPSEDNTKSPYAFQYTFGFEHRFEEMLAIKLEGYLKNYKDLISTVRLANGRLAYLQRQNDREGFARGADIFLSMKLGNVQTGLSYGYLEAKEKKISNNEEYYPRYTDQRHTASLVVSIDLGGDWGLSLRGFYGSGYAYTPYILAFDPRFNKSLWKLGAVNSEHYPSYERFDLRASKTFQVAERPLLCFVDILNVFGKRNILSYSYTYYLDGRPWRKDKVLLSLIPSIGVSYSF